MRKNNCFIRGMGERFADFYNFLHLYQVERTGLEPVTPTLSR